MLERPLVSIVTVDNGNGRLGECVASLQAQTYEHWELIVVRPAEEAGAEGTAADIAETRLCICPAPSDLLAADRWNFGLGRVPQRSRFTMLLPDDHRLRPNAFETLVEAALRHPSAGVTVAGTVRDAAIEGTVLLAGRELLRGPHAARLLLRHRLPAAPLMGALLLSRLVRDRRIFPIRYQQPEIPALLELLQETEVAVLSETLVEAPAPQGERSWHEVVGLRDRLLALQDYGPRFLAEEDYRETRQGFLRHCHGVLVRRLFRPRERRFLSYTLWQTRCDPTLAELAAAAVRELAGGFGRGRAGGPPVASLGT